MVSSHNRQTRRKLYDFCKWYVILSYGSYTTYKRYTSHGAKYRIIYNTNALLKHYSRTLGHIYKLKKNRFNRNLREHFFTERIINIWNSLDERTVTASTLNCFKRNLEHLRNSTKMGLIWTDVARP